MLDNTHFTFRRNFTCVANFTIKDNFTHKLTFPLPVNQQER